MQFGFSLQAEPGDQFDPHMRVPDTISFTAFGREPVRARVIDVRNNEEWLEVTIEVPDGYIPEMVIR